MKFLKFVCWVLTFAILLLLVFVFFPACSDPRFVGTWEYYVEDVESGVTLYIDSGGVGDFVLHGEGDWADFAEEVLDTYEFSYEYEDSERRLTLNVLDMAGVKMSGYFDSEFTMFTMDYPTTGMVFYKID